MYKKIASNTLFQLLGKILTAGISIILLGILTKNLSLEYFGVYNKIFNYLGIFAFLADLGLYTIAIREISKAPEEKEKIIGNILSLRIILGLIIWVISLVIASILPGFNTGLVLTSVGIIGFFTLISLVNSSLLALMQSQMRMEFSLISLLSGKLLNLGAVAILFLFGVDIVSGIQLLSVFVIATISLGITTYLNYLYAKKICKISLLFEKDYISHIFRISLPYGLALFLSVVYFKIDVIMLGVLEGQSADRSIALYSLPMKIIEVLMVIGGFYLNSLLPTLSKTIKNGDIQEVQKIVSFSSKILGSFGVCVVVFGMLFGKDIILILSKTEYLISMPYNSLDVVQVVILILFFHFFALLYIYILIAEEKQGILLRVNAFIALINIVGNYILIPHFSFYGAAITTLVSQIILCVICYAIAGTRYTSNINLLKTIGSSICVGILVYLIGILLLEYTEFGSILNIFFLGGILFVFYSALEYAVTRLFLLPRHT